MKDSRVFSNPNQLQPVIILARLRSLDPHAIITETYFGNVLDGNGQPTGQKTYRVTIESTSPDIDIENALATTPTPSESLNIQSFEQAVINFNNLPNWATWTAAEFTTWCDTNLLTDAQIDALTISAGLKTNLKANNLFTRNAGKAILFLRDYAIKLRR